MPFDLVIFDCDGVLVDSEVLSADALIALLAPLGIAIDRAHVRRHFTGRSFPTVAASLRARTGAALPADFEDRYRAALLSRFDTDLRPMPGIVDALDRIDGRRCVATSSSPARVARALAVTGLAQRFGAHVFTASEVARGKPFPDLFLHAARTMGAAPARTLVVEDSGPGIAAGLAAGMTVVAYTGGSHLAGVAFDGPAGVASFDNWADFPHLLSSLDPDPSS